MLASTITLSREELYEKVWSTPMQVGFSDVGLANCAVPPDSRPRSRSLGTPPGRAGRRGATYAVRDTSQLAAIKIYAHERRPREARTETEAQEIPKIAVAEHGPLSHRLAIRIEKCISRSKKSEAGLLLPRLRKAVPSKFPPPSSFLGPCESATRCWRR